MPKKSAGKKKGDKKGGAEEKAPDPTDGLTREQLQFQCIAYREELEREREERNFFQLERDKINTFWDITKRQLEVAKAEARNKDRDVEDMEEKHSVEIKVYKQKVKHLLYEHQNQITELKSDAQLSTKLAFDAQRNEETILRKGQRFLKVELKETELSHEDMIKSLQLEHDKQNTKLIEEMQRTATELQQKYEKKMHMLREELELKRKTEIHEIEERKNGQIHSLMRNHEKAFSDIKNYYNDITLNNLALINSLKEEIENGRKREDRNEKLMTEIVAENKRLTEPLNKAKSDIAELTRQLASLEKIRQSYITSKAQNKIQEATINNLQWEHEVLVQRFARVESERDELYDRFVKTIQDVQQKTGFKNLLLERKLGTLAEQLEKKEAQLNEVLAASNLDPTALAIVTRKLEDVLDSKNGAIKDLQFELAKACKMHNDLLRTYDSKLTEFGIPASDALGFQPLTLSHRGLPAIGAAPAGLVVGAK